MDVIVRYSLLLMLALTACSANQELVRSIQELRLQSIELTGSVENLNIQIEELENKTLLMNDRLERVEIGAGRATKLPDLPVVRFGDGRGGANDGWREQAPVQQEDSWEHAAPSAPSQWDRDSGTVGSWAPSSAGAALDPRGAAEPDRQMPSKRAALPERTAPAPVNAAPVSAAAQRIPGTPVTLARSADSDDPMRLYKSGYKAVMAGALEEGRQTLFTFLLKHASHDLADNALYWIGESYYSEKNYADAIQYFQRIVDDYPNGNKVPDAMVKAALTLHRVGEEPQGRFLLTQVVKVYPGTHSAEVARKKLSEWQEPVEVR